MIAVRFRPVADRIRMWSVWSVAENPLLVGYVREDPLSWIAKTREGPPEIRSGFRSRADAAVWIVVERGFAQVPPKQQLELREAA
jgi:hypothetical protein